MFFFKQSYFSRKPLRLFLDNFNFVRHESLLLQGYVFIFTLSKCPYGFSPKLVLVNLSVRPYRDRF